MSWWQITFALGALFQLLILVSMMTKSWIRAYAVLFFYSLLNFCSTTVEFFARIWNMDDQLIRNLYWIDEAVLQALIFAVVIALIHKALAGRQSGNRITAMLIALALIIAVASYWTYQGEAFSRWMTNVSRNLSFASAVLNLILWTALARSKHPDKSLLMLSAGLGIQTTGEAIGHSLRVISHALTPTGNFIIVLSYLICLFVWWRAFSETPPEVRTEART